MTPSPADEGRLGQKPVRTTAPGAPGRTGSSVVPSASVILAGGRGSRLGGRDKPGLLLGGRTLLQIARGRRRPGTCRRGGTTSGAAAGRQFRPGGPARRGSGSRRREWSRGAADAASRTRWSQCWRRICRASPPTRCRDCVRPSVRTADGAVLVDQAGRRQYLTGVWRVSSLVAAVEASPDWSGRSLRGLLAPLAAREVAGTTLETADVDTEDDWARWRSPPG